MIKSSSSLTVRSLITQSQCARSTYSTRQLSRATAASQRATTHNALLLSTPCRSFHASSLGGGLQAAERSHYETLGVPPTASKSDLKKRFYILSKETHPDVARNRNDPTAADRFSEISEAYTVLGNDEKRKRYDRDEMPRFMRSSSTRPRGSHSSSSDSTYAGSRPATGLSKRRGTFRGPPPSFYAEKNPSADEQMRREHEAYGMGGGTSQAYAGQFDPSQYTSPGQWDPTFNPTPVYKTQTAEDVRRNHRRAIEMAAAQAHAEAQSNFWIQFVMVSGVVAFGVGVGTMVHRMGASPRGGLVKADGSRRGSEKFSTS